MKESSIRCSIGLATFIVAMGLSGTAAAHDHRHWHRPHWGVGVYVGPPMFPLYPPVYYGPPTVVIREAPPVYIERGSPGYWYYCDSPAGYYPYVKECQGVWRAVSPEPDR
ncbi:MAG TPA: hypothetical protein VFW68_09770 [Rhodocyclaceae bacterium]|nr:hypothetical protein [Rhodocyclaceae bacterium]